MKRIKIYGFLSFLWITFTITSCVEDGSFSIPELSVKEPNITPNSSIKAMQTALQQAFKTRKKLVYTFPENKENPTYAIGYVISSDATGNFYKKLIIQDQPENPNAGVEIRVNKTSLSETFDVGTKVYILLDGLSVSYDDGGNVTNLNPNDDINPANSVPGKYILGVLNGGQVDDIPSTAIAKHILRTATVVEIVPTTIQLDEVKDKHINTMIQLPAAQFLKSDITKTFSGEPYDEFDGFRTVLECHTEQTISLQTSTFASFKSNVIPIGKGKFKAILSKDFRSEFLVAIINKPSDVNFDDKNRCDPPVLECGIANDGGNLVLFEEDFENIASTKDLTDAGWTNININNGTTRYEPATFGGNRYVQISAYNSKETPLEVWLISPPINLDTTTQEVISFNTNTGYDNGKALTTYIASDFTGDVTTATWVRLDAVLSEGFTSGYNTFINSGAINISCLTGTVHVAFKYKGANNGVTTTFQIDQVKVIGN